MCGYGGNTSCVVLEAPDQSPIIFDMGTGIRSFGQASHLSDSSSEFRATVLVTHLHWDHVQGLPFFAPLTRPNADVTIYGPPESGRSFADCFDAFMCPPYFPVRRSDLPSSIGLQCATDTQFTVDDAVVTVAPVPHTGLTNGYRVDLRGMSVAYIPDHQQPDDPTHVDPRVLELARDVDLLIHDAQYTPELFAERSDWGHCTIEYACEVAAQSGAQTLALFHHDPLHTDVRLDALVNEARAFGAARGVRDVIAAREGESIKFD